MIEMAHRLGYAVTPISKSRQELARAIASRMVNRKGDFVYQSAAFSITNFPLSALESIFPDNLLTNDPDAPKTWSLPSVGCVSTILGPLLQDIPMCGGASRALKTASERWSRVLATIYDMEISFTKGTMDHAYINFLYVLMDESGEMHKPKKPNRVEVLMSASVETEIRQQVLSDAMTIDGRGCLLSAGWLRSIGEMDKAAHMGDIAREEHARVRLAFGSTRRAQTAEERGTLRCRGDSGGEDERANDRVRAAH